MHAGQLIETSSNISLEKSTCETLKRLRNENLQILFPPF